MTINKILLYIEPNNAIETISQFAVNLAKRYDARLIALSIIKHPSPEIKSRSEDQAWKRLYEIEEDAFEIGIKISLLLEELAPRNQHSLTQKLINLCSTFQVDMVIISNQAKFNLKTLTTETTIPLIVVPESKLIK
jgi:hypothetical protein